MRYDGIPGRIPCYAAFVMATPAAPMETGAKPDPPRRRRKKQPAYKATWATTVKLDGGYIPANVGAAPEPPNQANKGLLWKNPQRGWCNGVPAAHMSTTPSNAAAGPACNGSFYDI